jgi:DNA-binding MarR family transcriptional regulator
VSSLVRKGLVSQVEDPGDRRQKTLRATPAGLETLARIEPARHQANKALFADFKPSEISQVLRILRSCLDTLWSAGLSEAERQRFTNGAGENNEKRKEAPRGARP